MKPLKANLNQIKVKENRTWIIQMELEILKSYKNCISSNGILLSWDMEKLKWDFRLTKINNDSSLLYFILTSS